ncbi:carbon-nitrogen hydrolase family protein [Paraburkholderia sediminicola]|uniref:carbon-nitrogen hydrolase family protein n=1 Tax=Paraburkholderia sediminicola TaxID=458836 RepID=UPI0038BC2EFA
MTTMTAACIQYTATSDWRRDVDTALMMLEDAIDREVDIAVLPEVCAGIDTSNGLFRPVAYTEAEHPALIEFSNFASANGIEIVVGSVGILAGDGRIFNSSFMIGSDGKVNARYDKVHLCDIDLPDRQVRESASVAPGTKLAIARSRAGGVGLSICYDLRFPHIYRRYAQAGANLIIVPAAFMRHTGRAHWHTLIRARAIETGCYVLAAGQCGQFENGVELFGHSLIVDPWGRILAEAGDESTIITASIDTEQVSHARQNVPAWNRQASDEADSFPLVDARAV